MLFQIQSRMNEIVSFLEHLHNTACDLLLNFKAIEILRGWLYSPDLAGLTASQSKP